MKIRLLELIVCVISFSLFSRVAEAAPKIIATQKDKQILQEKLERFSKDSSLSTGELMLKIGNDFIGTPYVAKTLDINMEESLIVDLREFDCTTFVENCLAIARTIKSGHPSFETFIGELEKIRYRDGRLNGYVSRLHYFSEWIADNAVKGVVEDMTAYTGGIKCPVMLNFMGTHPDSYPQLKGNPEMVKEIKLIEKKISALPFFFLPKENISASENKMLDGDITAFVTKIPGLDVSHVGILVTKNERIFLLNASQSGGKVVTTQVPLADYLKNSKNTTGIFVVRAK
jgi:hypothetical protein